MNTDTLKDLACPLDGSPLHCDGTALRCANGHTFDIASQVINLLPVQNKRSLDPGDSKRWSRLGGVSSAPAITRRLPLP